MTDSLTEALLRPALFRAADAWGAKGWTGQPSKLLFELAGFVSDPLALPTNPRAFSVAIRRLAKEVTGHGLEVIYWKSNGSRMITIRPLPVKRCPRCASAWFWVSNFRLPIAGNWLCGSCEPPPCNPVLWFNVTLTQALNERYWMSWMHRPPEPAGVTNAAPAVLPAGADPLLAGVRYVLNGCASNTYIGPVSWVGTASDLHGKLQRQLRYDKIVPSCPELLSKRLRRSQKELWAVGVDVVFLPRNKERKLTLQIIPASACPRCKSEVFWLDGRAWVCGKCYTMKHNPAVWFDRCALGIRERSRDPGKKADNDD